MDAPYLTRLFLLPERVPPGAGFPFDLPVVAGLDLAFKSAVTFFVGENGTGKSTLMESIAAHCGLPVGGGGFNERDTRFAPEGGDDTWPPLARATRAAFRARAYDGYFFRAEFLAHFASLLDARQADPTFDGDPYGRYGGKSLHHQSHGEAFFSVLQNRVGRGVYLLDEPEAALSPQRQLALLIELHRLAESGEAQLFIATHSPILLTLPGATILSLDNGPPEPITLEETSHYRVTRGVLENPEAYWRHLRKG